MLDLSPEEAAYLFWDIGGEMPQWNAEIVYIEDIVVGIISNDAQNEIPHISTFSVN